MGVAPLQVDKTDVDYNMIVKKIKFLFNQITNISVFA
jgi:hypothetical protein